MKVDAVIDPPDVNEKELVEFTTLPGSAVTVAPGWRIEDTRKKGSGPLWLYFYTRLAEDGTTSQVWVWEANGGKESVYGEMAGDEGRPYEVVEEQDGPVITRQDGLERGGLRVLRSDVFTGP